MRKKPNFVIIITDSQGANATGCYGHPELKTGNIDKLAQQGIRFERAYSTCPVCTPARAGIFTGLNPSKTGSFTNNLALGENIKTMGQRFSDLGYNTAYSGKWHLEGHDYFGIGKCPDGWAPEYWYDGKNYLDDLGPEKSLLWRQGLESPAAIKEHNIQSEFTWAHRVSDRGTDFINQQNDDKPFLLVVSYDEPHHPSTCPYSYIEPFENFKYKLTPAANDPLTNKPAQHIERAKCGLWFDTNRDTYDGALYFGSIHYVDHQIGRIIKAVEDRCPDNTYIIFTSDHGSMMGGHRLEEKGSIMYDDCTRIPFIIKEPNSKNAGKIISTPINHTDILPTLYEYAGFGTVPIFDGKSLVPVIAETIDEATQFTYMEFTRHTINHDGNGGYQPIRAIVQQSYKLVINLLDSDELYNLDDDPDELDNLINDNNHAEIRDKLHQQLLSYMNKSSDPFRGYYWERRSWSNSRTMQWHGDRKYRPKPDDGYSPPARLYKTGQPASGE
ncbi:MAG: sulfatase-like hydrolase/transferase [Victivallaceae bacterium]|nr:sulfatase-like hydrolase/transferase [Victivallaceae bacterium]